MLASFLFIALSVVGLAGFCPVPRAPLGVRLAFGWSVLVILLVIGAALLALPLRATSFAISVLAVGGLILRSRHAFQRDDWKHPATVLGLLAAVVIAAGPGEYITVAWDELTNWMYLARQFTVADRLAGDGIVFNVYGYTLGWPLLMAYPQALFADFDEAQAFPAIVVLHIATLALVFDFARHLAARRGMDGRTSDICAWIALAILLAAQAMWTLFPTLLLIEKPQIYSYVVVLVLAVWTTEAEAEDLVRLGAIAGLAFAASYLLKIAAITLVPALLILPLALTLRRRFKSAAVLGASLFAPTMILAPWWGHVFSAGENCLANPLLTLVNLIGGYGDAWEIARRLAGLLAEYYASYKPAVTVAAVAGLALGCRRSTERFLVGILAVFAASYFLSLLLTYISCMDGFHRETLISYERFGRVILRVVHTVGLLLLILELFDQIRRRLRADIPERPARAALALALAAFLAWQGAKSHAALREVATRANDGERGETVRAVAQGVAQLKTWIDPRADGPLPRVMIVAQGSHGLEVMATHYHALETRRGGPIRRFTIQGGHSFGATPANLWMTAASPEEIRARAEHSDVLWLVTLDSYARAALAPILAACPDSPFVVRTGAAWGCPPRP